MVSKAIDEGLLVRIQTFVASDINHRRAAVLTGDEDEQKPELVLPENVYILGFARILNNWQAIATVDDKRVGFYQITHEGTLNQTIACIYQKELTFEAIV